MVAPNFAYPDLAIRMMEKGINPHIIKCNGQSQIQIYRSSFESEKAKRLLSEFPRSVYFSIEDINCTQTCPADCSSSLKKFFYRNGRLVEMIDNNRIGTGGFGMVFKQLFHGIPMAMKCVWTGDIEHNNNPTLDYVISKLDYLNKNISEIKIQINTVGSGIIVPVAFVRQQDQEQDENGNWVENNYNIFVYPLFDCNLNEFHENHYNEFTEEILNDVFRQCLTRK